jgi:hypothetical protein
LILQAQNNKLSEPVHNFLLYKCLRAVSRKKLKWPFLDVKMRQNGFFFRIPHEKLGNMGVKYGVKNGAIQKSTISLKMVQNRHN